VRAMSTLSRRQREVVTLYYRLDLPVAEIASALDIDEGSVKTFLHRARRSLSPLVRDRIPTGHHRSRRSS
jgi:RNA polymerase sigma factor (sigma-70 family)